MFFEDETEGCRAQFSEEETDAAKAMLANCRQRMTGREIEVCERIASTRAADFDSFSLTGDDLAWFGSLQVQFAREIADWKDHDSHDETTYPERI